MENDKLLKMAEMAKEMAYSPYSKFRVGAALLGAGGKVYTGVNIENVSYGATNCAERTAYFKAVSEGEKKFLKIAIASDSEDYIFPCGICRQVMIEFGQADMLVICGKSDGSYKTYRLEELMPNAFFEFGGNINDV